MGCQVSCAVRGEMLQAVVSGRASRDAAAWIARAIVEQAMGQTVRNVLIDVRRLGDRLGALGTLALTGGDAPPVRGYRVAVVDVMEHDPYYALHEQTAKRRGFALRCFTNAVDAVHWLARPGD